MTASKHIIISTNDTVALAKPIALELNLPLYSLDFQNFPDGEIALTQESIDSLAEPLSLASHIFFFHNTSPKKTHTNLFEIQVALAFFKKNAPGAKKHLLCPYLAYLRHESHSFEIQVLREILQDTTAVVVEPHSLPFSMEALCTNSLIAEFLLKTQDPLLIAPDEGASSRVIDIASILESPYLLLQKKRLNELVTITGENLEICQGRNCIFIDDILATGETLLKSVQLIRRFNPLSIQSVVVHNLATKEVLENFSKEEISLNFFNFLDQDPPQKSNHILNFSTLHRDYIKKIALQNM